jgi:hypothetical protein
MRSALRRYRWHLGLIAAIILGAIFRLIWPQDVEYKGDEAWTFLQVQDFWTTHSLAPVGMKSSSGLSNPGMSFWVFLGLSAFAPIDDPLALTRAVEVLNVAAVLLLAAFACTAVAQA